MISHTFILFIEYLINLEVQSEPKVSDPSLSKCIEIRLQWLRTQWLFLKQDTLPGKWSKSVNSPEIHSFKTAHEHNSLLIYIVFIK